MLAKRESETVPHLDDVILLARRGRVLLRSQIARQVIGPVAKESS